MVKIKLSYSKGLLIALLFVASFSAFAQDIHFTQFYEPSLTLNPSNTGKFDGDWRFNGIFRSQWGAVVRPFVTTAMSYDQPVNIGKHRFGIGGFYVFDKSGDGRLMMNKVMVSLAYHKNFAGHLLSLGVQGGFNNKNINFSTLSFPGQYDNLIGSYNTTLANGETFAGANSNYFDFNLGLGWSKKINPKLSLDAGYSIFHLNSPHESLANLKTNLEMRHVFNASAKYDLNDINYITPNILYMYDKAASNLVLGANYNHKMLPNKYKMTTVFGGVAFRDGFFRTFDATALVVGCIVRDFRVGVAYDINLSPLSTATTYRGAFEISITYIAQSSTPKIYTVPCEIY